MEAHLELYQLWREQTYVFGRWRPWVLRQVDSTLKALALAANQDDPTKNRLLATIYYCLQAAKAVPQLAQLHALAFDRLKECLKLDERLCQLQLALLLKEPNFVGKFKIATLLHFVKTTFEAIALLQSSQRRLTKQQLLNLLHKHPQALNMLADSTTDGQRLLKRLQQRELIDVLKPLSCKEQQIFIAKVLSNEKLKLAKWQIIALLRFYPEGLKIPIHEKFLKKLHADDLIDLTCKYKNIDAWSLLAAANYRQLKRASSAKLAELLKTFSHSTLNLSKEIYIVLFKRFGHAALIDLIESSQCQIQSNLALQVLLGSSKLTREQLSLLISNRPDLFRQISSHSLLWYKLKRLNLLKAILPRVPAASEEACQFVTSSSLIPNILLADNAYPNYQPLFWGSLPVADSDNKALFDMDEELINLTDEKNNNNCKTKANL